MSCATFLAPLETERHEHDQMSRVPPLTLLGSEDPSSQPYSRSLRFELLLGLRALKHGLIAGRDTLSPDRAIARKHGLTAGRYALSPSRGQGRRALKHGLTAGRYALSPPIAECCQARPEGPTDGILITDVKENKVSMHKGPRQMN